MIEKLALLTPRSVDLRKLGRTTGETLTPAMVAGAMAAMSAPASALCYAKYLTDGNTRERYRVQVYAHLIERVIAIASAENWTIRPIQALTELAIEETLGRRCNACKGASALLVNDKLEHCTRCNGTGQHRIRIDVMCERLHMSKRNYYSRWRRRYGALLEILRAWDDEIFARLREQLHITKLNT